MEGGIIPRGDALSKKCFEVLKAKVKRKCRVSVKENKAKWFSFPVLTVSKEQESKSLIVAMCLKHSLSKREGRWEKSRRVDLVLSLFNITKKKGGGSGGGKYKEKKHKQSCTIFGS